MDAAQGSPVVSLTRTPAIHLGFLDSLRGIAILLVLAVHAALAANLSLDSTAWHVFFMGQRGVELFYLVSAFTLFLSLDQVKPELRPTRNFYIRRFFRIAPAFYVFLLAELLLAGFWLPEKYRYPLAFLFLNGWSPRAINLSIIGCWSIAVETTFYVFVPWLHRRIRTLQSALLWFIVSALLVVPVCFALGTHSPAHGDFFEVLWFPAQIPVFLLGIIAYMMWKDLRQSLHFNPAFWTDPRRKAYAGALLLGAAFLFFGNIEWGPSITRFNARLVPTSLSFVCLILSQAFWESRVLCNAFTRYLGKISFSMYLSHFFLLWAYARFVPHPAGVWLSGVRGTCLLFLLLLAIDVPLSAFFWRFVEMPGIRLGRNIIMRAEARDALAALHEAQVSTTEDGRTLRV